MKTLSTLIIATILVAFSNLSIAQMTTVQPKIKKIVVNGSAETDVDPDEIYVNFVLSEYYNSKKEKTGIETVRKEFLTACEKSGITKEQIRVDGMAGSGYQDWFIRKKRKETDFVATITYIIKFSDTKSIDKLVPALNDNAVTNMYISKVSHSKMETFRKEIKIKSVQAAREKAIYLAESIGEKVGPALLIEEVDFGGPQPMMYKSNMMMEAADAPYGGETSMPFEKIKIRFETRVEFELN